MFWTGFIIGMFVEANIGVVVAGLLVSAKRNDAKDQLGETLINRAVLDKVQEFQGKLPSLHEPITYLDKYPHT